MFMTPEGSTRFGTSTLRSQRTFGTNAFLGCILPNSIPFDITPTFEPLIGWAQKGVLLRLVLKLVLWKNPLDFGRLGFGVPQVSDDAFLMAGQVVVVGAVLVIRHHDLEFTLCIVLMLADQFHELLVLSDASAGRLQGCNDSVRFINGSMMV